MATELTAVDYLTRSVDRNRYFYGKLMTVRDFLREQEYFNSKRWLINRLLFGSGIVCGLEVTAPAADGPTFAEIQPGVAFDPAGREITVLDRAKVDLARVVTETLRKGLPSGGTADVSLFVCLEFHECPKEPVPTLGGSPCEESCESNRVGETYTVTLKPAPPVAEPPTPCENWLNRQTVRRPKEKPEAGDNFQVERVAPVWVRQGEVFEVALKVTALRDMTGVMLNEAVAGGTLIEPDPQTPPQFPTTPVSLRKGEFFVYVYQVQARETVGDVQLSGGAGVPTPPVTVKVLDKAQADEREAVLRLGACPGDTAETCVPVARIKASFETGALKKVELGPFDQPRLRYTLTRVAELLDCVRASLRAEAESPRPGHLFITFKDLEQNQLQPIGPANNHGNSFTVPRGDHVHALLLYNKSGLDFEGNKLRIEGDVGGKEINFLNPVWGQTPTEALHLATKDYVDSLMAGLDWQESVLDKDLATAPTEHEPGDRYLIPGSPSDPIDEKAKGWDSHPGHIATWDGKKWVYTKPDEGTAVFVEDEKIAYLFAKEKWIPFLATPEVAAGDGLYARNATLSVGQGAGLKVNTDDVEVVFHAALPSPVGLVPSAGTSPTSARGDHTHELPLTTNGGLAFGPEFPSELPEGEPPAPRVGLQISGVVGGANIDFRHPVSGQRPTDPRHLATKQYVDGVAAGLDWQNSVLDKDLAAPPPAPHPGSRYLVLREGGIVPSERLRISRTPGEGAAEGAESEAARLPPVVEPGPRPFPDPEPIPVPTRNAWTGRLNNIATWTGTSWTFVVPNEGTAVFVEDENTAYLFVDGRWTPFMAMPSVAAGAGLFADGAQLSVGQGSGLVVSENSVDVAYHAANPTPVGPTTFPGAAPALARGDHTHELPLVLSGGLEFVTTAREEPAAEGEERVPEAPVRLRVNGRVNGDAIDFLHPVSGQDPVAPRHLATKQYVDGVTAGLTWQSTVLDKDEARPPEEPKRGDRYLLFEKPAAESAWEGRQDHIATWAGKRWDFTAPVEGMAAFVADENLAYLYADGRWVQFLAPPTSVGAGDGLFQSGTDLAVGQGAGILVSADAVSVNFGEQPPSPVGTFSFAGSSALAAQVDHTHELPLAPAGGLQFVNPDRVDSERPDRLLRVNGKVGGESIDFLFPVAGQTPTESRHLATKEYVDSKGLGAGAGDGLVSKENVLSVVVGPGLVVNPDEVHVNFHDEETQPVGEKSSPGSSNAVARGDHTHAMPDVWGASVATGVVAFNMGQAGLQRRINSLPIDPKLGLGPIAVVVGLETERSREGTFTGVGDINAFDGSESGTDFGRFPGVLVGAVIFQPFFGRGGPNSTFEIWAQATPRAEVLPETFRVRWWAYRVGTDHGVIDYMPPFPGLRQ